jgi:hypothetical protein
MRVVQVEDVELASPLAVFGSRLNHETLIRFENFPPDGEIPILLPHGVNPRVSVFLSMERENRLPNHRSRLVMDIRDHFTFVDDSRHVFPRLSSSSGFGFAAMFSSVMFTPLMLQRRTYQPPHFLWIWSFYLLAFSGWIAYFAMFAATIVDRRDRNRRLDSIQRQIDSLEKQADSLGAERQSRTAKGGDKR